MLSSISPFGERSRNSRWWLTVTAYLVGSIAGGASIGLLAGLIGELAFVAIDARTGLVVLGALAVVGVAMDLGWFGAKLPSLHRQVNEDWLTTYRGWIYGLGFGYQLGLGVVTIVTTSTLWLMVVAAAMTGSWHLAVAIGALFGLVRGALILGTVRVHDPTALRDLFRTIAAQAPSVHRLATIAAGLTAVTALGGALT
jgi:hypothetical protein